MKIPLDRFTGPKIFCIVFLVDSKFFKNFDVYSRMSVLEPALLSGQAPIKLCLKKIKQYLHSPGQEIEALALQWAKAFLF